MLKCRIWLFLMMNYRPLKLETLEEILDTQIIDRSFLIPFEYFPRRAKTKGAVLEVSLAQQKYFCQD